MHTDPQGSQNQLDRQAGAQAPRVPWSYQHWQEGTSWLSRISTRYMLTHEFSFRTVVSARVTATTTPPAGRPGRSTTPSLSVATGDLFVALCYFVSRFSTLPLCHHTYVSTIASCRFMLLMDVCPCAKRISQNSSERNAPWALCSSRYVS